MRALGRKGNAQPKSNARAQLKQRKKHSGLSSHFTITVKQEFYYMPNGLTYRIHSYNSTKFLAMLGEDENMTQR